jgi:outer membrane lipase/esterase
MKKLAVLGALFPLILLTSSIASAFDLSKVHNLVVFGDSLSDNGNTYVAAGLPPYYHGRWTMGITGSIILPELPRLGYALLGCRRC